MKKEEFLSILRDELIQRGLTPALSQRQVRFIELTLTPEDVAEIESMQDPSEISALADGIMSTKFKTGAKSAAEAQTTDDTAEQPQEPSAAAVEIPADTAMIIDDAEDEALYAPDNDVKIATGHGIRCESTPLIEYEEAIVEDDEYAHFIDDDPEDELPTNRRGRTIFWAILIGTLPVSIALLAVYFGLFGAVFALLAAIMLVLIGGVIGGAAVGAAVSLIGIVYGITQLITVTTSAPGLYEIGLGMTVGGAVIIVCILMYNCAIRLMPWLFRLVGAFFKSCTSKLKALFKKAKEACYRL